MVKHRIWDLDEEEAANLLGRPLTEAEVEVVIAPLVEADRYTPAEVTESLGILAASQTRAGL